MRRSDKAEVAGSNPARATTRGAAVRGEWRTRGHGAFVHGLGHGAFNAGERVRVPHALPGRWRRGWTRGDDTTAGGGSGPVTRLRPPGTDAGPRELDDGRAGRRGQNIGETVAGLAPVPCLNNNNAGRRHPSPPGTGAGSAAASTPVSRTGDTGSSPVRCPCPTMVSLSHNRVGIENREKGGDEWSQRSRRRTSGSTTRSTSS